MSATGARGVELSVRILCLDSGQGPPSALQLRRLLGFSVVVDHVAPADRCEVAVYENPVSVVETAEDRGSSTSSAASDPAALSPGSQQSPSSSGSEPPSNASPPQNLSGIYLSPPHKSSMSARPSEGFKVTQMKVHFEHCISALNLYFVDKQDSIYTLYRLEVRYSTICRIVLCKKSSTATTAYLHLLHTPLLYNLCAGKNAPSHCPREDDYIPKVSVREEVHFTESTFDNESLQTTRARGQQPLRDIRLRKRRDRQQRYARDIFII
ncbi:hypothetical protein HPB51_028845 [Rhipicephalus microplus]|uniref:Uncharacterized protein n=1 Tax=Rhipicephalus microplus TaxID=6941 RepID=A0A9J6CWQ3_RHIMP|nr:hypothetical protein HPB51_028845 [Rhipicephalus microplus]